MLTGKQKGFLRSIAHHLNPIVHIGKNGITENLLSNLNDQLESHELVKVTILQNCDVAKEDLIEMISYKCRCDLVQTIGNQLVFYRESHKENKNDKIVLPK